MYGIKFEKRILDKILYEVYSSDHIFMQSLIKHFSM
jgi:metal-dependent HD superfamily phosphatase/phosphodiesterase